MKVNITSTPGILLTDRLPILLCCVLLLLVSCATVPHSGRRQLNFVSDQQLDSLGAQAFKEIVSREPISEDKQLTKAVKQVADRITKVADETDKPGFDWQFRLIDRDIPNAFVLPGGRVVIYKGILPLAKNEAGLAAIIGHEVAHAVARHGAERLSQQLTLKGITTIGSEIFRSNDGNLDAKSRAIIGALGFGATVGVILPFSRTHELEADKIGQIYMAKAGYDPEEAVRLWQRMGELDKGSIPVWLSTHPPDQARLEHLRERLPEARKLYDQAKERLGVGATLD